MTNDITIIKSSDKGANDKGIEICLKEENIRDNAKSARELFSSLQGELDEIEDDLKDGLSYLDMKNDTLLSYMIDFCNIVLHKVRGEAISGHPSVERSVYYRVILEKIKAIDQKLAYQLNKVITMPENADGEEQGVNINNLDVDLGSDNDGEEEEEDQVNVPATKQNRHLKTQRNEKNYNDDDDEDEADDEEDDESDEADGSVNSEDEDEKDEIEEDDDDDDDDDDEDDDDDDDDNARRRPVKDLSTRKTRGGAGGSGKKAVGVYKPPKLRSVAYNDGSEMSTRRRRDYNEFYQNDDGDDIHDIVEESRARRDDERTRYEEENYTRLPTMNPKKAKRKLREQRASKAKGGNKKFKGGKPKRK